MTELARKAERSVIVTSIRAGLIDIIPIVLIGAFALVLNTFPVEGYLVFIRSFAGGFLSDLFGLVNSATFGLLSVYMTIFISRAYMRIKADAEISMAGAASAALVAFFILAGSNLKSFGIDNMGPKSMFLAIIAGLGGTALYVAMFYRFKGPIVLSKGADSRFNLAVDSIKVVAFVALIFAFFDGLMLRLFNVDSFREILLLVFSKLIGGNIPTFGKGLFFVFLTSFLWFFGIHGSDVLEDTMQALFVPGLEANQAAVAAGLEPTSILTKQFFDCFVLMGGCGATICLLISILIFSKIRSSRELGIAASVPMIFNINELMVLGLPIIYNPVMLIPFIVTPLICYCIAYAATYMGLVPMITAYIEWTTPVILSGYLATGSTAGSILQIVNLIVGVLIYTPFVKRLDIQAVTEAKQAYESFMKFFLESEATLSTEKIKDRRDVYGEFARDLTAELRHALGTHVKLYYQPQYDYSGKCTGVESLLRWEHTLYGMLYPPLVVRLADEGDFLPELEEAIMLTALSDMDKVRSMFGEDINISFNVTGSTIITDRFIDFCRGHAPFTDSNLSIEVTEQVALNFDQTTIEALKNLRNMGLQLAIDDFSMGATSMHYLKDGLFDVIKLDGSLIKGLSANENCREIVHSIIQLADSLHMQVIAEYVETEEQREILHELGCDCYQGWLYLPAVNIYTI